MKITVEFNSLQEISDFCGGVYIAPGLAQAAREEDLAQLAREEDAQPVKEAPKAPDAKKSTPKKETAKNEVSEKAEEAPKQEEAPAPKADKPVDIESLKVEVRKLLAQVNKKTGSNTASQWIKELTSVEKLTEVESAEELLALKAKAEEVLNG